MPIIVKHLVHPYSNAFGNRPWSPFTANLFQAYFATTLSGFAGCGENLASISQFVAGIRQGSSFKRSTMKFNERAPERAGISGAAPVASYSAGRDIGAESEPSTTGIKFDIAATDQIRPIATTTAIIHASICIPSTSR